MTLWKRAWSVLESGLVLNFLIEGRWYRLVLMGCLSCTFSPCKLEEIVASLYHLLAFMFRDSTLV